MNANDDLLTNFALSDDEVANRFLAIIGPAARMVLGPTAPAFVKAIIKRERSRCANVMLVGMGYHGLEAEKAEGEIIGITTTTADDRQLDELVSVPRTNRIKSLASAAALQSAQRILQMEPGSCEACGGLKVVPAAVMLSGGQRPMIPCPRCAPAAPAAQEAPKPL